MLAAVFADRCSLCQKVDINLGQSGWRQLVVVFVVGGCEPVVKPTKRHVGLWLGLGIKEARKTLHWGRNQLHVFVKPTTPAILSTVEKDDVICASALITQRVQDGPCCREITVVQGFVLSAVAVCREDHNVRAGEGVLVGDENVRLANVAHVEASGADIASITLGCRVSRVLEGGFAVEGAGEEEADL